NAEDNADPTPCDQATVRESSQTFIKRVVGVGGDVLTIKHGHVYRNGVREHDSYIAPCGAVPECTFTRPIKVPRGMYYMMGDNRGDSDDSRFWGPVPKKWIIGVAFFTYWPPDRIWTLLRLRCVQDPLARWRGALRWPRRCARSGRSTGCR